MPFWLACTILPSLATATVCTRTERAWLQHCAVADDCTSESSFCSCCGEYPNTEYAEACEVICGMRVVHARSRSAAVAHSSWDFEDFGDRSSTSVRERGPTFEQPALSLIGDAAVVLGDCYNLDVRARATADTHAEIVAGEDGQEACLIPPVTPRLFSTDAHLALNLSVCPSRVAPFHVHDPQPAALAAMLCFDECRVRNTTQQTAPPPVVDYDALRIANCTRQCFVSCVVPAAAQCAADCGAANYTCFATCHREATTCSVPMGQRDVRYFRADPNAPVCTDEHDRYRQCVIECNGQCHEELARSQRTVHDDVRDWYNQTCSAPLGRSAVLASSCVLDCETSCQSFCNQTVTAILGPELGLGLHLRNCTSNCSANCDGECFVEDAYYGYEVGCRPSPAFNCTEGCYTTQCPAQPTFCSVYDALGALRAVDLNCTFLTTMNVTFEETWSNMSVSIGAQLADPSSALSQYIGLDGNTHICYNDCTDTTTGTELFFHAARASLTAAAASIEIGRNCTTRCYERACLDSCTFECTLEAARRLLPPCVRGPECISPTNCTLAESTNCSAFRAFEPVLINITAVTMNMAVWVPPWTQDVCEDQVGQSVGSFRACYQRCPVHCANACPLPVNHTMRLRNGSLYNDTSGACLSQCHYECAHNCSLSMIDDVASSWCVPPLEPIPRCVPPLNCTDDCYDECLDPTLLLATDPECEEFRYGFRPDGSNHTVISIPYAYNVSSPAACARNETPCSAPNIFYNLTTFERDVLVSKGCVQRCAARCVARCFDRYCVTRLEEPVNDTAICLPRCLDRFFEASEADDATVDDRGAANATTLNVTACQLSCHASCIVGRSSYCSALCESYLDPTLWGLCLGNCYANASVSCHRDCVYGCTSNHTLAYGFAAPYNASGDYMTAAALVQIAHEDALVHAASWSNAAASCYNNCTRHCATRCFEEVASSGLCALEVTNLTSARAALGIAPLHPQVVAEASNNCTLRRSATCLDGCQHECHHRCTNLTDPIRYDLIQAAEYAELYATYVEHCESRCRIQIYGPNTTDDSCLAFTNVTTYRQECLFNCTDEVRRGICANPNITVDVGIYCNATERCGDLHVLVRQAAATPNASASIAAPYHQCMQSCSGNFTLDPQYVCDGGVSRLMAIDAARAYQLQAVGGLGQQGTTPAEQLEMDRLWAAVPMGEMCTFVNLECVVNHTFHCASECANQVAFYYELCVARFLRRNATFNYNISSCYHPDGWRVGTERWRYYAALNASRPEAQPSYWLAPNMGPPVWTYNDVPNSTVLNCSCHFLNETFDPNFVAALLEWRMRPYQNHYISTCLCLFNASAGEPQHCIHDPSEFVNVPSIFDWVFGKGSGNDDEDVDHVAAQADELVICGSPCMSHCSAHCGVYFVEHVTPSNNGGSAFLPRFNETFRFSEYPASLTNWVVSNGQGGSMVTPGHWRSPPGCFQPCMATCAVTNCTDSCGAGCAPGPEPEYDNSTALDFGCEWNSTVDEGRPLCYQFCGCYEQCASRCVAELPTMNTSTLMLERFPVCIDNCSSACEDEHHARCVNISAMLAASRIPPTVNQTQVCLNSIFPTCSLHCLGISIRNVTNTSGALFVPSKLPRELLSLNLSAGLGHLRGVRAPPEGYTFGEEAYEGYACRIDPAMASDDL